MPSQAKSRAKQQAAAIKAEQERRERRRRNVVVGSVIVVAVLVIGGLTAIGLHKAKPAAATTTNISGLQTFTGMSRQHVDTAVTYPQNPPVGGAHSAVWQNCGFYSAPVHNENAVHSMEHGAVWITYSPSLSASDAAKLRSLLAGRTYVLASPYAGLPAPVVASAWGAQVKLTGVNDPRLEQFISAYANSPKAPEPGGECTGGTGNPS